MVLLPFSARFNGNSWRRPTDIAMLLIGACFCACVRLPGEALVYLVVGCRLCRQIPVRLDLHRLAHLRITVIPQRWPTRRGYARVFEQVLAGALEKTL